MSQTPSLEQFSADALRWLEANATYKTSGTDEKEMVWGEGRFSVSVFHALTFEEEKSLLEAAMAWNQKKAEVGYHAIVWPVEFGGMGLTKEYARAFSKLEQMFVVPTQHETFSVTTGLIAPTVRHYGSDEQKADRVGNFLATRQLCCQLFSEPGAGSDLAGLSCRAELDGDEWVINGQKVWSSGAQFSQWGELIVRHDPDAVKHKGLTAFLIPMDLPGIEVRPIRQMSGGASFCEVFFNDVRVPDSMRLGPIGEGWKVALTTLGYERDHSSGSGSSRVGGSYRQLEATARAMGVLSKPDVRAALVDMYIHTRVEGFVNRRAADLRASGAVAGPEGSLGKIVWTQGMTKMSAAISTVLGARLVANTGEWGTYEWTEHVLGAPGYRIAGGSDEVQRNIIGERVLGLPGEPRVDNQLPWSKVPR